MLADETQWTWTIVFAALAVCLAAVGLGLEMLYPGAAPLASSTILAGSLVATGAAFARVAMRVRRLELENLGLIEEISQEFDRVKDKLEIFSEALADPRSIKPEDIERAPLRRVTIK